MSTNRTYRVLAHTSQTFVIDVAARSARHACDRAQRLWDRGERQRFAPVMRHPDAEFEIDEEACIHLADIANDDRADWAEKALKLFARETGSDMGPEALHDLLCDLGHYADRLKVDFREEVDRAAATWAEEKAEGGAS